MAGCMDPSVYKKHTTITITATTTTTNTNTNTNQLLFEKQKRNQDKAKMSRILFQRTNHQQQ